MNEQEYRARIEEINKLLEGGAYPQAKEKLDALYAYKPVRLEWFVLHAAYLFFAEKKPDEAKRILTDVAWEAYPYEGILDQRELLTKIYHEKNDPIEEQRSLLLTELLQNSHGAVKRDALEVDYEKKIAGCERLFLQDGTVETGKELAFLLYAYEEQVLSFLLCLWLRKQGVELPVLKRLHRVSNMGYLKEVVEADTCESFVVLTEDQCHADVFTKVLQELGNEVWVLILDGTEDPEEIAEAVGSIAVQQESALVTVLGTGETANRIEQTQQGKKFFRRLSAHRGAFLEDRFCLGWYGSYLSYIGRIYHLDVRAAVNRQPEYDFSVVIPARNASKTLRDTIRTCIGQEYDGTYEIVISDNSNDGTDAVYELVQKLQEGHLHYYRTPRDLPLAKSFEYAFLQARGEFIFSIGADDALLPWTLQILAEVRRTYASYPVLAWKRGFYAWKGFNGGQQHQLEIPGEFPTELYPVELKKGEDYLVYALLNPDRMYDLPMLYINSGFHRSYMQQLLEQTGCLWDGIGQDIYMGVVTACIVPEIPYVDFPLSIAGMSAASIGASGNAGMYALPEKETDHPSMEQENNVGCFCASVYERFYPAISTDRSALYSSILRCVARGILPEAWMKQVFDWKKWIHNGVAQLDIRDIWFDKKLHMFRYAAMQQGEEMESWFDREIYPKVLQEKRIDEEHLRQIRMKKSYREEVSKERIVLDASKYGIDNIYEASRLIVRIKAGGRDFLK